MVIVVPVLAFAVAWAYTVGTNYLALIPWRRSVGQHWTERARILYPVRRAASTNVWVVPINCTLICWWFGLTGGPVLGAVFGAGLVGSVLGTYQFDREQFPTFTLGFWARHVVVMLAWRMGVWLALVGVVVLMPSTFGWWTLVLGAGAAGFVVSLHYGLWCWPLAKTGLLVRAPKPLTEIVQRAAQRCGVRFRNIWMLRSPAAYAAALPSAGDLIFSEGMLARQTPAEIDAVCAHELAHLNESRGTIFLRLVITMWILPLIFINPVMHVFGLAGVAGLFVLVMLPLLIIGRRLGRRMEVRADLAAREYQLEPGVYARALERLYEINQMPAVMPGNRMIHPHLYDRLLAAGVTPAYLRPAKPRDMSWHGKVGWMMTVALGMAVLTKYWNV
jgi:Zn-dependent protease with chaperone function